MLPALAMGAVLPASMARAEREDPPFALPRTACWETRTGDGAGHRHSIFLAWPDRPPPPQGYPVLYLLDGKSTFPMAVAGARQLNPSEAAPALLVGLDYPDDLPPRPDPRARDFTPMTAGTPSNTGRVEHFLDFIEHQLQAEVARRFPVDPARQFIFGHSYGGLCALHAFFTRPHLFRRTVAASPSIWWQDGVVLEAERRFAAVVPSGTERRGLLITVGSEEQPPAERLAELPPQRQDRLRRASMVTRARDLARRMAALRPRGPETAFRLFEGETHSSVVMPALALGLRFALRPEAG